MAGKTYKHTFSFFLFSFLQQFSTFVVLLLCWKCVNVIHMNTFAWFKLYSTFDVLLSKILLPVFCLNVQGPHHTEWFLKLNIKSLSVCIWSLFSLRLLSSMIHTMTAISTMSVEALSLMVSILWRQLTVSSGWVSHWSLLASIYTYTFVLCLSCQIECTNQSVTNLVNPVLCLFLVCWINDCK